MKDQALQYFMHDGPSAFRLELAGDLNGEGARRLDQDWRVASAFVGNQTRCHPERRKRKTSERVSVNGALIVDMTFVTTADEEGRALLARWHASGAKLVAESEVSRELAAAILGGPLAQSTVAAAAASGHTWLPFRASFGTAALPLLMMLLAVMFPLRARAANLKPETIAAWDAYVQAANTALQDRVRPGGDFLWSREDPQRLAKVQGGETVVAPVPPLCPRKVPGGLIHHWIGAAFLPGATLDGILAVTRDYDHYKEFYAPGVVASKTTARGGPDDKSIDRFSMLLMSRTFFLSSALEADYQAANVRLDDRRFYSVSQTTRVQEVEDYGEPSEHRMPAGEGSGYIWKLFSIARLEQSNEGVYLELETIALSRDIPGAVRLVVDPIVRRVSRNSMLISMKQTGDAVRGNLRPGSKTASSPATAVRTGMAPSSPLIKTSTFLSRQ